MYLGPGTVSNGISLKTSKVSNYMCRESIVFLCKGK